MSSFSLRFLHSVEFASISIHQPLEDIDNDIHALQCTIIETEKEKMPHTRNESQKDDSLPAPGKIVIGSPVEGIIGGLIAAVFGGVLLFGVSRFAYFYGLYNFLLGILIASAIERSPEKNRFTDGTTLFTLTFTCCVVCYLSFNVAFWLFLASGPGEEGLGFFEFLTMRAQHETQRRVPVGPAWNVVIWIAELAITFAIAWYNVNRARHETLAGMVPRRVLSFVRKLRRNGYQDQAINNELMRRGWTNRRDRERAIQALDSSTKLANELRDNPDGLLMPG